ncbi:MAG: hypothetical protein AAFW84_32150 [Cyanobacteria bacterium J06635_15]
MVFFNGREPILRRKQTALDIQDLYGLIKVHWQVGDRVVLSLRYTRIDQVFVVWAWITAIIFGVAQFSGVSWAEQAIAWSALTAVGIGVMVYLAWFWVAVERFRWLIYLWAALMALGIGLTDFGIFGGMFFGGHVLSLSVVILMGLCPLWLGLTAVGYGLMGIGMRSRTFLIAAVLHGLAIPTVMLSPSWQFLSTGIVMAGTLALLAEVQWDMRPPQPTAVLSEAERQFNRQQHQRRQLSHTMYRDA